MSISTVAPIVAAGVCLACLAAGPAAGGTKFLSKLRKEHPRLLFTADDQSRVEKLAETDALLARLIETLNYAAAHPRSAKPLQHRLIGPRLLDVSRECLARVSTCAMAYRLTGNKAQADRAIRNMLTVAAFPDWNPSHFLDVAEMTAALAIGYDWLYDAIDEADRKTIREAIVQSGLKPGLKCYAGGRGWPRGTSNWNQVCNGGMTLGALAVAESYPDLAEQVVAHAVQSLPRAMGVYPPDGAYPEGPGYWKYGTSYNCLMLSALETALGDTFGLAKLRDFDKTGLYRIHMIDPTGLYFNYPDCGATATPSATMFYLSRTYDRPMYAWWQREQLRKFAGTTGPIVRRKLDRLSALEIAWYDERGSKPGDKDLPLDAFFRNEQDVVAMRSAWDDPNALYVGFKGGANQANHAHLDIGSFVLSADGVRWAVDLGGDNYNLSGYWSRGRGGKRWNIYRLNNRSHNTLVIADQVQDAHGKGKVALFQSTPQRVHAVVDMSSAYAKQASKVLRGVAMLDRRAVLVRDEVTRPVGPVRWGMVVAGAECKLDGASATLTRDGKTLSATILEPAGATFEIVSTKPPTSRENPNQGTFMLATTIQPARGANVAITILLRPVGKRWDPAPRPTSEPLVRWKSLLSSK